VAIGVLIVASTLHPTSILARPLSLPILSWLGTVSYSVYVWQQIFFANYSVMSFRLTMMCLMPVFALASYYYIERPATRFGHWLTQIRASEFARELTL
jgi:peptidoglycan/LPS O-acetylase OafA/YrhL